MRVIPVDENNLWKVIVERIEAGEYVFFRYGSVVSAEKEKSSVLPL